jgi:alpha-2-macroglobulin
VLPQKNCRLKRGLVLPSRIAQGYGSLTIKASTTLKPYIEPALSRLLDLWPYYEWNHYANLAHSFALLYEKQNPDLVQRIFKDLQARQVSGGGLYTGSWNWQPFLPNPWISLMTAHAMQFAKSRQVVLNVAPNLNQLLDYLQDLKEAEFSPYFRAYLAYVLNINGRNDKARLERLEKELEDRLGLGGYNLLAQAWIAAKDTNAARRVYQRSKNFILMGTQKIDIKETYEATDYWSSLNAELALFLKNAVDLKEDRGLILRIAGSLNRSERYWQTTNDDLWTLLGFVPLLDAEGPAKGEGQLDVSIAQTPVAQIEMTTGKPQGEQVLPFFENPLKPLPRDQVLAMDLKKTGKSPLYYTTLLRYALPNETAVARDEGIGVFTRYETLDGKSVGDTELNLGETYRVRVNLSTSKRRQRLNLWVPVPSGTEIVDPSFTTTSRFANQGGTNSEEWTRESVYGDTQTYQAEGYGSFDGDWYWYWYRPDTFATDNMMVYRWTDFYAGSRDISFLIRVTTPGIYPTPPANASLEFEPEVFGRSEGRLFVIQP